LHIYLGLMVWRDMSARHGDCLTRLFLLCRERGIQITNGTIYGDALVSRAQSVAASCFVRSDADVMLTIGSDTIFEPEDAIQLCEYACEGYDIIGAVVMKREENPIPACPIPGTLVMDSDQRPVEVSIMGTGFTATHRRVLDAMVPTMPLTAQTSPLPFWPFYMPAVIEDAKDGYLYLSEDWAMAHRAKKLGFKCWIDPTVRVGHLSTTMLTMEDMLRPRKAAAGPMRLVVTEDGGIDVEIPDAEPSLTVH